MTTYPTFLDLLERAFRRCKLRVVFEHFDEDGDGKISIEELKNCLAGCFDIHVDDDGEIERFLHIDRNSKIESSQFAQVFESEEDDNKLFQNLRKMKIFEISSKFDTFISNEKAKELLKYTKAKELLEYPFIECVNDERDCSIADAFRCFDLNDDGLISAEELQICLRRLGLDIEYGNGKDHKDHVIDLSHLPLASTTAESSSNISKLRDILFGLTGQAGVSLLAYSPTRPLYVIVAANALAFLFLLVSFCLRGSKQKLAERITGAIGIAAAAAVFFLMMGTFFAGRNM